MKAYFTYFKLKFMSGLQYRSAAWAGIATQFFFGFVYVMVYIAFYESGEKQLPMNLHQVITYLWLNQAFFALVNQFHKDPELFQMVKDGTISYELVRPKNLYFMWYFKILGQRLSNVVMRFIPIIFVTSLLPYPYGMEGASNVYHFFLFLCSLMIGTLVVVALSVLYPIITLATMNEKGIVNVMLSIADILSGIVVPIPFFPLFLQKISKYLPFQYISDLPFRIYVGNVSFQFGIRGIFIQLFWFLILVFIGFSLMKRNIKRIVVQGG